MGQISRRRSSSANFQELENWIEKVRPIQDNDNEKTSQNNKKSQDSVIEGKSRWSSEFDRVLIPGLPVALPGVQFTDEQRKIYTIQLKIEEIDLKLRTRRLGIPLDPGDRSPSPEPVYNTQGVRLNTREIRVREKLEAERHELIKSMMTKNLNYKPPFDYKNPANILNDKVFIPQERYPHINFTGLLLGPRGNTIRRLETDTNCKLVINGKGSSDKGKSILAPIKEDCEPLHALITATSETALSKGILAIKRIVKDGIYCRGDNNKLRQMQLRELAVLNGTNLECEIARCRTCGTYNHLQCECTKTQNSLNILACFKCGYVGHLEMDCRYDGENIIITEEKYQTETKYQHLKKELNVNSSTAEFPLNLDLPKALVKDLPWINPLNSFVHASNAAGRSIVPGHLRIFNQPFNTEITEESIPFIPGAAPMPTFTVRTLMLSDNQIQYPQFPTENWQRFCGYSGYTTPTLHGLVTEVPPQHIPLCRTPQIHKDNIHKISESLHIENLITSPQTTKITASPYSNL